MGPAGASQARFARVWRGRTAREKADEYAHYLLDNGIAPLERKGALAVQMLREDQGTETEFVTVSWWASLEAMTGGSGEDPRRPHHLPRDADFLIALPERVHVLSLMEARGRIGGTDPPP